MTYEVVMLPRAMLQLSELWFAPKDQNEIMAAVGIIKLRLAERPFEEGESREIDEDRIAFEPPLQFSYRVILPENRVQIVQIGRFGRSP